MVVVDAIFVTDDEEIYMATNAVAYVVIVTDTTASGD